VQLWVYPTTVETINSYPLPELMDPSDNETFDDHVVSGQAQKYRYWYHPGIGKVALRQ
jgi:hypothetical protein